MAIPGDRLTKVVLLAFGLAPSLCVTAGNSKPWPREEKQGVIERCRSILVDNAIEYYMQRHQLSQAPADLRKKATAAMNPRFGACDCLYDDLERQWDFQTFKENMDVHQDQLPAKVHEAMSGPCVRFKLPPSEAPSEPRP